MDWLGSLFGLLIMLGLFKLRDRKDVRAVNIHQAQREKLIREAVEKQERDRNERQSSERKRKYAFRAEVREWITLAIAILGLTLAILSILWQMPLHGIT